METPPSQRKRETRKRQKARSRVYGHVAAISVTLQSWVLPENRQQILFSIPTPRASRASERTQDCSPAVVGMACAPKVPWQDWEVVWKKRWVIAGVIRSWKGLMVFVVCCAGDEPRPGRALPLRDTSSPKWYLS
jgi:hypothetical protein